MSDNFNGALVNCTIRHNGKIIKETIAIHCADTFDDGYIWDYVQDIDRWRFVLCHMND